MEKAQILLTYKREILSAVFGALITAVLSLAVGIYNMNKSFELTQKKDLLYSLRTDIALMRNVEKELDENLNLLLNYDYTIVVDMQEVALPKFPLPTEKKSDESFKKLMDGYFSQLSQFQGGNLYKVTKIRVPPDRFVVDVWTPGGPGVTDIDFELVQDLNDLYRKLSRANEFLKNMGTISQDMIINKSLVNSLNYSVPQYNKAIAEITRNKILKIKNKIASGVNRLQKERNKINL